MYEQIDFLDISVLSNFSDEEMLRWVKSFVFYFVTRGTYFFFRFRTQQMEVIRRFKKDVEKKRGCRIAKVCEIMSEGEECTNEAWQHIYIVDLKGLSLGKHFNEFVRKKLPMIFKISQEGIFYIHIIINNERNWCGFVRRAGYPDCLWTLWYEKCWEKEGKEAKAHSYFDWCKGWLILHSRFE